MKTLRRPMFRRGGNVDGGITSGMRENFENGTPSERIMEAAKAYSKPAIDPVAQLLIEGGLSGLSTTGGGGTLANLAKAFKEPTSRLFQNIQAQREAEKELAIEGVVADINQEIEDEKRKIEMLKLQQQQTQFDEEMQNRIDVEIQKGQNKIAELQFKLDNPDADPAKKGVIPSIITQQIDREKTYTESGNLELQKQPDFHARKVVNFERTASPEVLAKFKGIVFYDYGTRAGEIIRSVPGGEPGDIIYDPKESDFFIFDNQGNTYRYDPATNSAEG